MRPLYSAGKGNRHIGGRCSKNALRFVLLAIFSMSFITGCGVENQNTLVLESQEREVALQTHFEKTLPPYHATLDIADPPLEVGKQESLILRVRSDTGGKPLRGARRGEPLTVNTMTVKILQQRRNEPPQEPIWQTEWIAADTAVRRMTEPGAYHITAEFPRPGKWHVQILPNANPKQENGNLIYFHVHVQDT